MRKFYVFVVLFGILSLHVKAENNLLFNEDTLTIENSVIRRQFLWNKGELISVSLIDKKNSEEFLEASNCSTFFFADSLDIKNSYFKQRKIDATNMHEAYQETEVLIDYGILKLKRLFRVYSNVPAIACDNYIRIAKGTNNDQLEKLFGKVIEMERINVSCRYPRLKAIEFFDRTDQNNNLVKETDISSYCKPENLRGNILQVLSPEGGKESLFILKEAPCSFVQLGYPGYDFSVSGNRISVVGIGQPKDELIKGEWVKLYGSVIGYFDGTAKDYMHSLHSYQRTIRRTIPERDDMIMMNTWGDRNQDAHISEVFVKKEIDEGKRLGITHFQIDDGWQQGHSVNSAIKMKGDKWELWNVEDWQPNKERFPNGFKTVANYAKSKGIQLGLWFNPSHKFDYKNWENDANVILGLYRNYGVRYFKIDGTDLPNKLSAHRFGLLMEKVNTESDGKIVINLDVTALKRTGYFYRNNYGNIFLENRYTDFGSYYPHWTLRNLWQLSANMPVQNLQIEFLNKWRNREVYGKNNPLAPYNVSFEYMFAITMMAQPLAWFEATGLPVDAYEIVPVIKKYRSIQTRIHSGDILPIGEEPSGYNWTGFQSVLNSNSGYLLVFREKSKENEHLLSTYFPANTKVHLTPVLGKGQFVTVQTNADNEISLFLPCEFSYALYSYKIEN